MTDTLIYYNQGGFWQASVTNVSMKEINNNITHPEHEGQ